MTRTTYGFLTLLAATLGCGGTDAKKLRESIASDAATARLTSEQLHARHVTRTYAAQLARRLRESLDAEAKKAASGDLVPRDKADIDAALGDAHRAVAEVAEVAAESAR